MDIPLLEGLSPEERDRLDEFLTHRHFPAGTDIIRQGDRCETLFVVRSGSLLIHTAQRGELGRRGPGESLGEVSLFTGERASATVTAITDTVLLAAPHAEFRVLLQNSPALARNFCRLLSDRLAFVSQTAPRSPVTWLITSGKGGGAALALNLAASLAYHLQQEVALLAAPASHAGRSAAPAMPPAFREAPPARVTVVATAGPAPDSWAPLADRLALRYAHVLVWVPAGEAPGGAPDLPVPPSGGPADRVLLALAYEGRRTAERVRASGCADVTDLVVLGAPEPRSVAMAEEIEREAGVPVAALLPEWPALPPQESAQDWVLRHPQAPLAQGIGRLARRLAGKTVGLALGAGAARGHAHIGVLQALERLGIRPDYFAGCSIGACVGGLYVCGVPFHEMDLTLQRLGSLIQRRAFPVYSLMAGSGLDEAIRGAMSPGIRIEDVPIPCAIVAADLVTGEEVVLRRGCGWESVRASATIPGVFPPMRLDGRQLVDGGVVNPVPCRPLRDMGADIILGVSLETLAPSAGGWGLGDGRWSRRDRSVKAHRSVTNPQPPTPNPQPPFRNPRSKARGPTWPAALLRSLDLLQQSLTQRCLQDADVALRVFTPPTRFTDFRGGPEFLEAGERAVEAARDRLHALLPWTGPTGGR